MRHDLDSKLARLLIALLVLMAFLLPIAMHGLWIWLNITFWAVAPGATEEEVIEQLKALPANIVKNTARPRKSKLLELPAMRGHVVKTVELPKLCANCPIKRSDEVWVYNGDEAVAYYYFREGKVIHRHIESN